MNYPDQARRVIRLEIEELESLHSRVGDDFSQAIGLLLNCVVNRGKLIVCGVGKSGNIGRKLTATLNNRHTAQSHQPTDLRLYPELCDFVSDRGI